MLEYDNSTPTTLIENPLGPDMVLIENYIDGFEWHFFMPVKQYCVELILDRPMWPHEHVIFKGDGSITVTQTTFGYTWPVEIVKSMADADVAPYFFIGSFGTIISKRSNRVCRQNLINQYLGHVTKIGGRNGTNRMMKTHIEVAKAFVGNSASKPFINHIDGDKFNNMASNLEWATAKENTKHSIESGLSSPGENYRPNQKLFDSDLIDAINRRYRGESYLSIAKSMKVSPWTLSERMKRFDA